MITRPAVLFVGPGTLYVVDPPQPGDTFTRYQMVARNRQFGVLFNISHEYLPAQRAAVAWCFGNMYLLHAYAAQLRAEYHI